MNQNDKLINNISLLIFFSVILLTSCRRSSMEGMIIATETITSPGTPDYATGDSWRYISRTRLLAIDPTNPDESPEIITSDFFSARSPEVSYDGKFLLFTAQQKQDDNWHIWEMDLGSHKVRQVTSSSENSIDPGYLPGGRIVFSRYLQNDTLKSGHALFTCNIDGTDLRRITFNPHVYFAPSVLKDGRIIAISRQIYPTQGDAAIMVLRPDGTKAELFYDVPADMESLSRGWETSDGKILFVESGDNGLGEGAIVSVNYNRPLHSRVDITSSVRGDFKSVFPMKSGKLLVSYRPAEKESYSLYEFDAESMSAGKQFFESSEGVILEAVEVNIHERPRKLPSEVDMGVKTGLLLCQNINVTGMTSPETGFSMPLARRIEVMGVDSSLGIVDVNDDGSVYLKVAADMPFRIRTLDAEGKIVNGPGGWYWLRPNERRGCIGCHEDQEMVPANRYATAVSKDPVTVPVHVKGVIEKEVELE